MNKKPSQKIRGIKSYILVIFLLLLLTLFGCQVQPTNEDLRACTLEYAPVCGTDNVTYGNRCMAGNRTIAYQGECGAPIQSNQSNETDSNVNSYTCTEQDKDNQICTQEYNPVCGSDNETYGNGCNACANRVDWFRRGECPQQSLPPAEDLP